MEKTVHLRKKRRNSWHFFDSLSTQLSRINIILDDIKVVNEQLIESKKEFARLLMDLAELLSLIFDFLADIRESDELDPKIHAELNGGWKVFSLILSKVIGEIERAIASVKKKRGVTC